LASEGRIRKVAKLWRGDDYIVEDAPFLFPLVTGLQRYKSQIDDLFILPFLFRETFLFVLPHNKRTASTTTQWKR